MSKNIGFLNSSILGSGAGVLDARGFTAVRTNALSLKGYRSEYFETCPSSWASAYAFRKLINNDDGVDSGEVGSSQTARRRAVSFAVQEWICLFALHYLKIAHLVRLSSVDLLANWDPDLWPALAGTFPALERDPLDSITVLRVDERTIIGGYYPEVVFFPSRGRATWADNARLRGLLDGPRLSWQKIRATLLPGEFLRDFEIHLRCVAQSCLTHTIQQTLRAFCDNEFKEFGVENAGARDLDKLSQHPFDWQLPGSAGPEADQALLEKYPLRQKNGKKGFSYYLLAGLETHLAPWMNAPIAPLLPAPADFRKSGDYKVSVDFAGRTIEYDLDKEKDEIVLLKKDLLLPEKPYATRYSRNAKDYAARIRSFHILDVSGSPGIFAGTPESSAVCLLPVRAKFLEHFPLTLSAPDAVSVIYDRTKDLLRWTIDVLGLGKPVIFTTSAVYSKPLADSSVAIWPSKVSPSWRMYAAKGTGTKQSYGRWALIDQHGIATAEIVDIDEDEYVSVLTNPERECEPRALLLRDAAGKERGVLVLAPLDKANHADHDQPVTLAVDFGTSNTCIAYRVATGEPATLEFQSSPVMVWGQKVSQDTPETAGFVPFNWGGKRGYYPTILLSQVSATALRDVKATELEPKHLFMVDIPGLHNKLESAVIGGKMSRAWSIHKDLKWEHDPRSPWRALFLGLSLVYAHGEVLAARGAIPSTYIFTYPLAFTKLQRDQFHAETKRIVETIRRFCYGVASPTFIYVGSVDESRAIAKSAEAVENQATIELFIDVGGGTADIAIRHAGDFLVLDSVKLAGKAFFRFTEQNLRGSLAASDETKSHLAKLNMLALGENSNGLEALDRVNLDLGTAYSLVINGLDEATFRMREGAILEKGSDLRSYQRYRSQLFFRHLLAYGLLQTCAAAVDHKINLKDGGINLICSGNAWGLLLFANLHRSKEEIKTEATRILASIKDTLTGALTVEEAALVNSIGIYSVNLMNENEMRLAKTSVALGAIRAVPSQSRGTVAQGPSDDRGSTAPYLGVTLKNVIVNRTSKNGVVVDQGVEIQELWWCQRWSRNDLMAIADAGIIESFQFDQALPTGVPMSPLLTVFTKAGNLANRKADPMGSEAWNVVNGRIREAYTRALDLDQSPINYFLSSVLYPEDSEHFLLNELARFNKCFSN